MIEELYEAYHKDVYIYIYSLCHDASLSEDLTSETFYQMILSLPTFKGKASLKTWLFSIARHVTFKELRKRKKEVHYDVLQDGFVVADKDRQHDYEALMEQLMEWMQTQPLRAREIFKMNQEGYSYVEIAAFLQLNENSVRVIDYRNRLYLRQKLSEEGYHER